MQWQYRPQAQVSDRRAGAGRRAAGRLPFPVSFLKMTHSLQTHSSLAQTQRFTPQRAQSQP